MSVLTEPLALAEQTSAVKMSNGSGAIHYPETDGEEMGETAIHFKLINQLFSCLEFYLADRSDVFMAANLMVYYEKDNPRKYYAPDLMLVFGASGHNRSSYKVWEENQFPQVVVEVASESTYENDLGKKRRDYEQLGVEEYFLLDPENEYLPQPIMFFRLEENRLRLQPISQNSFFSERLGLEFRHTVDGIRLFDPRTNQFLRTLSEAEAERLAVNLENERLRRELERLTKPN